MDLALFITVIAIANSLGNWLLLPRVDHNFSDFMPRKIHSLNCAP